MTYTDADLVKSYVSLRDKTRALEAKHKEELSPLMNAMEHIENALHARMNEAKQESVKTEYGTAYKVTNISVKTADRGALMSYVRENNRFDLLTAAVGKEAVKDFMEASGGHPPPGIDVTFVTSVNFRRA